MTQLCLFDVVTPATPVIVPATPNKSDSPADLPQTAAVGARDSASRDLVALAEQIREGQNQMAANQRAEDRVSRIGDLAQAVLRRHDLVARRRAAAASRASLASSELADSPVSRVRIDEIQVAS